MKKLDWIYNNKELKELLVKSLKATPTVISKTGLFDNIDKLYGSASGATPSTGASTTPGGGEELAPPPPPPPSGGEELGAPPAPEAGGEEAAVTPESKEKELNILLENDLIKGKKSIDLSVAQQSLGEIEKELDKLLNS
jgi:hypothetical protein